MQREAMPLFEHIAELRKRILIVLAVLMISMIGGLFAADWLLAYMKSVPPASNMTWNAFSLWDGIRIYMQFAFVLSLVITLPAALYQLWAFVSPGLKKEEQKAALRFIPITVVLFLIGVVFAYGVVFQMAFYFTTKVNRSLGLVETYGISQYFAFMFNIILPISLLFELPVVFMFLTKLRIVNPLRLKKLRRYAYLLLVIIGTMVTPPDLISDVLVIIPLILLYEFSVLMSGTVYRKQLERDRRWAAEFQGEG